MIASIFRDSYVILSPWTNLNVHCIAFNVAFLFGYVTCSHVMILKCASGYHIYDLVVSKVASLLIISKFSIL